jgi:hypothetical protein
VRPQTTRVKARGFGAARISDAAAESGQACANRAERSAGFLPGQGRRSGHGPQTLGSLRSLPAADPAVMAARVSAGAPDPVGQLAASVVCERTLCGPAGRAIAGHLM